MKAQIALGIAVLIGGTTLVPAIANASGGLQPLCFTAHAGSYAFEVPWDLTDVQEKMLNSAEYTKEGYGQTLAKFAIGNMIENCLTEGKIINGFTVTYSPTMGVNQTAIYSSSRRWYSINKPGRYGSKMFIEGTVVANTMWFPITGQNVMIKFKDTTGLPTSTLR